MSIVDFKEVSTVGLESSPVAEALAGLRANEARYFSNKFERAFETYSAEERPDLVNYVAKVLSAERGIVITAKALEAAELEVTGDQGPIRWTHVFYEDGLAVNVLYTLAAGGKRAVGFKLSEGMEPPVELEAFKWARQKSKLAGTIRGSYFVVKGEY